MRNNCLTVAIIFLGSSTLSHVLLHALLPQYQSSKGVRTAASLAGPGRTPTGSTFRLDSQRTHDEKDEEKRDAFLMKVAKALRLEVFDVDEGIFGFSTLDSRYGIEVVQSQIHLGPFRANQDMSLGLVLTEMAGSNDGRGLVLISDIQGPAAQAPTPIRIGDVITGVLVDGANFRERTTGLNYERTIQALGRAKQALMESRSSQLTLEINRLVERAKIQVEVVKLDGSIQVVEALAGENLRRLLLRKGIKLYDRQTKRFDMPYAQGDCAGEGLCGTCLVSIDQGMDSLAPRDSVESLITRGRPLAWRAACRTVVGADNQPATIRLRTNPQTQFADELDPGVKSVSPM